MDRHPDWREEPKKEVEERTARLNCLSEEIAELKKAQKALIRDNEEWANLFGAISDPIMVVDDQHRILRVNKPMADALGMSKQEVLGQYCFELVHGEKTPRSFCPHARLLADGKEHCAEFFISRLGGTYEVTAFPLRVQEGRVISSVHVARDISEKKRTEEKIQQQANFLENILSSLAHPFYIIDASNYTVMVANKAAGPSDVVIGHKCYATHGSTDPCTGDDHPCPLKEVKKTGRPRVVEHVHFDDMGHPRNVAIHCYPIKSRQGEVVQVVEYAVDITDRRRAEDRLMESEKRYRRLFEGAPLMYVITRNKQGVPFISECNARFLRSLGYRREEVVGQPLADFYSPKSQSELLGGGGYARALAGEFFIGERELLARDGRLIPTLLYTATELDPAGRVTGTRAMFVDITEQKRAEAKLRESEERYRLLADNTLDLIWQTDLQLRFTYVNPAIVRVTGYTPDELIGSRLSDHCDEENFMKMAKVASKEISKGPESSGAIFEAVVLNKNKEPVSIEVHGKIVLDKDGRPVALQGVARDITERKQAEEARLSSEKKYRTLFDESRDGVYAVLREGEITDANPSLCEMFGYTKEELIGKDFHELYVDPADRSAFQKEIEKKGFVKDYEIRFRKKDGTEVDCLLTASVQFADDGSIIGYRGIMRDLTIHKGLQNQLFQAQKMEAIGTMAGGIAHDFNNMLQIILASTDLLIMQNDKNSPDLRTLETIRKTAKEARLLAKRLLAFSRRDEGNLRPIDLCQHLRRFQTTAPRIISRTIDIEIKLADDLNTVNADPIQLNQLLVNLLINSRDAMPRGGKLTVEARNVTLDEGYCRTNLEAKPGEYVLLRVSDTGHGMEKEVLSHIFEPFYTTKKASEGTGLGLAIVYGIVKTHKGHVTCASEPGRGTSFSIYLPTTSGHPEPIVAITSGEMIAFGTETILLVEDEERIRNVVEQILTPNGYQVLTAGDGYAAMEIYREKKDEIDLVVLDLNMPGMGGVEVLDAILKIHSTAKILIATGYSTDQTEKELVAAGASGFIAKPFDAREFLKAVRRVLEGTGPSTSLGSRSTPRPVANAWGSGPLAETAASHSEASLASEALGIKKVPLRILAIDDRERFLTLLEAGLSQFGHTALSASSGVEGLQVFLETRVDVVICDLGMPGLDGWEVGRRIKEICRERKVPKTPFVLLTGDSDLEDPDEAVREGIDRCGVDAIIVKPVDVPDLLTIIENIVRGSKRGI